MARRKKPRKNKAPVRQPYGRDRGFEEKVAELIHPELSSLVKRMNDSPHWSPMGSLRSVTALARGEATRLPPGPPVFEVTASEMSLIFFLVTVFEFNNHPKMLELRKLLFKNEVDTLRDRVAELEKQS